MDGELTGAGIATAAILVITAVAKIINEWRKDRHAEDKEKHGGTIGEFRELKDQYAEAYAESRKEVHELRNELQEATMRLTAYQTELAVANERIGVLEELLARHTDLKWPRRSQGDSTPAVDVQD